MRVSHEVNVSPRRYDGTYDVSGEEYGNHLPIIRTDLGGLKQLALKAVKRIQDAEAAERERRDHVPC